MQFEIIKSKDLPRSNLSYNSDDYSFIMSHIGINKHHYSGTTLLINDLELGLDDEGCILWADGYCPYSNWKESLKSPPPVTKVGLLKAKIDKKRYLKGGSIRDDKLINLPVLHNKDRGYICLGEWGVQTNDQVVEFMNNAIAVLRKGGELRSIWLYSKDLEGAL